MAKMKTRRDRYAPIIAEIIDEVGKSDAKKLNAALLKAYKQIAGACEHWPYKVWRSEVRKQLKMNQIKLTETPLFEQGNIL